MSQDAAGPVGAQMARACDGCLLKRARWYCADDDVFLCQPCDKSSHSSAKQRSHHHVRVRLKSSTSLSNLKPPTRDHDGTTRPAWQRAITRKARTPRMHNKHGSSSSSNNKGGGEVQERMLPVVPDLDINEEAEDLIFSVPIFNPVLSDQLFSPSHQEQDGIGGVFDVKPPPAAATITECLASDLDIADFDMDMDSLFGHESQSMYYHMGDWESGGGSGTGGAIASISAFMESSGSVKEEATYDEINHGLAIVSEKSKDMMLKLDFDAVIHDWSSTQGSLSPWTDGKRPSLSDHENMELTACIERGGGKKIAGEEQQQTFAVAKYTNLRREAMVSKYREKRRTRLFSKKIRYEVRKLNAEKRPRIKGRFVKRKELVVTGVLKP